MRWKTLALFCLACTTQTVNAEPMQPVNNDFYKTFVGVEYGSNEHVIGIDGYDGDLEEKASGLGLKGGYWVAESIAVALGYVDFSDAELSDLAYQDPNGYEKEFVDGDAITASAILSSPTFNNPWRFYAELGLFKWNYAWDVKGTDLGRPYSISLADDSGINIWGGLGGAYDITDQLEVKLGFEWYTFNPSFEPVAEQFFGKKEADVQINRMTAGLNFQF